MVLGPEFFSAGQGVLTLRNGLYLLLLWLLYYAVLVAYRISPFHPLHQFPGPKLAAASHLYEIYFDVILGGKYTLEIKRLHDIYGTISADRDNSLSIYT